MDMRLRGHLLRAFWKEKSTSGLVHSLGGQTLDSFLLTLPMGRSFITHVCGCLSWRPNKPGLTSSWAGKMNFSFWLPRIFQSPKEMETLGTSLLLAPSSQPHFSFRAPGGPEGGRGRSLCLHSGRASAFRGQPLMWAGKNCCPWGSKMLLPVGNPINQHVILDKSHPFPEPWFLGL